MSLEVNGMIEAGLTFAQSVVRILIYAVFLFIVVPLVLNLYKKRR